MNQVFTPAELAAKGFSRSDVQRMMKKTETRVNSYAKQYAQNGFKCSESFQRSWDIECAKWDHLKTTLAAWH